MVKPDVSVENSTPFFGEYGVDFTKTPKGEDKENADSLEKVNNIATMIMVAAAQLSAVLLIYGAITANPISLIASPVVLTVVMVAMVIFSLTSFLIEQNESKKSDIEALDDLSEWVSDHDSDFTDEEIEFDGDDEEYDFSNESY